MSNNCENDQNWCRMWRERRMKWGRVRPYYGISSVPWSSTVPGTPYHKCHIEIWRFSHVWIWHGILGHIWTNPRPQFSHIRFADGFMISAVSCVAVCLVFMCLFKFCLKLVVCGQVSHRCNVSTSSSCTDSSSAEISNDSFIVLSVENRNFDYKLVKLRNVVIRATRSSRRLALRNFSGCP